MIPWRAVGGSVAGLSRGSLHTSAGGTAGYADSETPSTIRPASAMPSPRRLLTVGS